MIGGGAGWKGGKEEGADRAKKGEGEEEERPPSLEACEETKRKKGKKAADNFSSLLLFSPLVLGMQSSAR